MVGRDRARRVDEHARGEPRRVCECRPIDTIDEASVSFQSIAQWDEAGHLDAAHRASRARVWRDRGYGDAWPYMLLAEGRLEFVAEFGVKDTTSPPSCRSSREAGGRFTSFDGNDSLSERSSLATNGVLHSAFLDLLHTPQTPESTR